MKQRARVLQRVVGSTALWCICCLPPDAATMTMLNSVQLQLMVWMLRFARRAGGSWEEFRQRAFRGARSALHSAGVERWSTLWLRRYWAFAGHRVRATLRPVPTISSEFGCSGPSRGGSTSNRSRMELSTKVVTTPDSRSSSDTWIRWQAPPGGILLMIGWHGMLVRMHGLLTWMFHGRRADSFRSKTSSNPTTTDSERRFSNFTN